MLQWEFLTPLGKPSRPHCGVKPWCHLWGRRAALTVWSARLQGRPSLRRQCSTRTSAPGMFPHFLNISSTRGLQT